MSVVDAAVKRRRLDHVGHTYVVVFGVAQNRLRAGEGGKLAKGPCWVLGATVRHLCRIVTTSSVITYIV